MCFSSTIYTIQFFSPSTIYIYLFFLFFCANHPIAELGRLKNIKKTGFNLCTHKHIHTHTHTNHCSFFFPFIFFSHLSFQYIFFFPFATFSFNFYIVEYIQRVIPIRYHLFSLWSKSQRNLDNHRYHYPLPR